MMKVFMFLVLGVVYGRTYHRNPLRSMFPKTIPPVRFDGVGPGSPLFLTPYLEKGMADKARMLSEVGPLTIGGQVVANNGNAGYLTVDKTYNSNMFFWFYPALVNSLDAPVLLWLQGGPGGPSVFGMFNENGPFYVDEDMNLQPRKYGWTNKYNMLYIDNPVGCGFSFTGSDGGYSTNQTAVADNLYRALTQFFQIFSAYKNNPFYITGESYAGKYVPAIAYRIYKETQPKVPINLKGMAIGDGLCDPETMLPQYGDFMFNTGLLDENQRDYFNKQTALGVQYIKQGKWVSAFNIFDILLNGDTIPYPSFFTNATGSTDYYNFLRTQSPPEFNFYSSFLQQTSIRSKIHVGNLTFHAGDKVEHFLLEDVMKSVKPWISELLDSGLKSLFYSGQLDVIIAVPLTEAFLQTVDWQWAPDYKTTGRLVWKIQQSDIDVAGYVRQVNNLYQVIVRGGGHILPYDQPARTFDMIDRFINDKAFHK
ncbi:unnamed protein product [Owenia fusiformis]|uniref:Carboxypeptidase n=1 Tax=Owenia fusiformis TaxID=6347 RepID=A0A8J1TS50_OWEFU|nr:unnamed protein product [Owenia fusiformis]